MATSLVVRDVFRLTDGTAVLVCEAERDLRSPVGAAELVSGLGVRQTHSMTGERTMLNASTHPLQRALETRDAVQLSAEEAQSGVCRLVLEVA